MQKNKGASVKKPNTGAGSNPQTVHRSNMELYDIARQWNNREVVTEQRTSILKRALGLDPAVDRVKYEFITIHDKVVMHVQSREPSLGPRFFIIDQGNNHVEITDHQVRMHRLEGIANSVRLSLSNEWSAPASWQQLPALIQSALNLRSPHQERAVLEVYNKIKRALRNNANNDASALTVEQPPRTPVNL